MRRMFFVFSIAKKNVREGTGLRGWRDHFTMDTKKGAKERREMLKKDPPKYQVGKVLRRIIKSEVWA